MGSSSLPPTVLKETLGAKWRREAAIAELSNKVINIPWLACPAWTTSEAIRQGMMRRNASGLWVAENNGTTNSTGTGPSNITVANVVTDGTVQWLYCGGATTTTNDPLAPTVTFTDSSAGVPTGAFWQIIQQPNRFTLKGCYANPNVTTLRIQLATFNVLGSNLYQPSGGRVCFKTDAPLFAIQTGNNDAGFRIYIDDRLLSDSAYVSDGGGNPYTIIDFRSVAARKQMRKIEIESMSRLSNGLNFFGVYTANTDIVIPVSSGLRMAFISDSYAAGSNFSAFRPGEGICQGFAKRIGVDDPWNFSIGGTGYIATNGGAGYTYGQRIAEALTRNPDIWCFMGSTNDDTQTPSVITAAALACYRSIRAGGSQAPIVVFGVTSVNSLTTANEAAIQQAVTQFNDKNTWFVPISSDPIGPWITGSWNNSAFVPQANAPLYINNSDNIHPTELGTTYLQNYMAAAVRREVLPYIL